MKEELFSYTVSERWFLLFAMLCNALICADYSIIRPISNSLFIHTFSASLLPYVWIATIPFNWFLVSLYNRLIPKWGSKKLFIGLILLVIGLNSLFALLAHLVPESCFLFYIWKEIYVMLMFQLLWSVIHTNISLGRAKYLYGICFGVGAFGSMFGSLFPGFFATRFGSENLIFLSIPLYFALLYFYLKMLKFNKGEVPAVHRNEEGGFLHGVKLIASSRFLIFALLIVIFMQMSATLIDFQFNDFLNKTFQDKDIRTQYAARVFGVIHSITFGLQWVGSFFLIQWLGFKRTHYAIPLFLSAVVGIFAAIPVLAMVSFVFIAFKSIDFSLFNVTKEMLYIPLKTDDKFRARSVIDVFAYRTCKAFAALTILLLPASYLTYAMFAITLLWVFSVSYGLKQWDKVAREAV